MTRRQAIESYVAEVRREGAALADAAEGELARPVSSCPGWSLVQWYRPGVERLAATLESTDPATPTWSWAPEKNVGFIQRRMAQETAVHRAEADLAAGRPARIEAALAADGVDEFFEFFLADGECTEPGESIQLLANDADASWLVTVTDGGFAVGSNSVTDENGLGIAKGSTADAGATVRGSASDLLLALWRRRDPAELDTEGDRRALERFLARADLE
jgi:MDMPI-like protein/mycothiol maleylpyruvate isomerase-like protein